MTGRALAHPFRCLLLLILNLMLLGLVLTGLSFTGLVIDILRHGVDGSAPVPKWPYGFVPPAGWSPLRCVVTIALAIIALAVIRAGLRMSTALAQGVFVQTILTGLRCQVYDKLQRLSFRFFDANETGSIINRATTDSVGVATFAEVGIVQVTVLAITLTAYFAYMLHLQPMLAVVSLATTPLLLTVSIIYSRMVRPAYERNRKLYDNLILSLSENIQGHHVVKGFALEGQQMSKFHAANDEVRQQQRWLIRRAAGYSSLVSFLTQCNLMVVLIVGGGIVIAQRSDPHATFTVGGLIIFASLLREFSNQVTSIANIANTLQFSLTAAGRVYEVLAAPVEIQDAPQARHIGRAVGRVEFQNVSFGYKSDDPVVEDVSFIVEPGQCIAILGATGSGKSSLLSLLPRFYDPTGGRILLDGQDIRDLKVYDLRRNIGMVFQESFLFSNTVAANIAFGTPTATRQQIIDAAKIAAAHEFIMQLPKGYDTVIGEQGSTLSGGQRQRLAIARAIVLQPPILLLDDATAAIDPETEEEIMTAVDNAIAGRTTFVVAHRLSTLRRADRVLVLDKGRIVQAGTHEELVDRAGQYADVARMQVADAESLWIIRAARWEAGEIDTPFVDMEGVTT